MKGATRAISLALCASCAAPEAPLGDAPPLPDIVQPLVAPEPAPVFEAGTGAGPMQDILLVRVIDDRGEALPGVPVRVDSEAGSLEVETDARGERLLVGVQAPADVHVFAPTLFRSILDVSSAALTVRVPGAPRAPPERRPVAARVIGLDALPPAPVRFAHVRHWAWPGQGALRAELPVSEDVAIRGPGLPDLDAVQVLVPSDPDLPAAKAALLTLFGTTSQTRLTSWGREVGWADATNVAATPQPAAGEAPEAPIALGVPLDEVLEVHFERVRRHSTLLSASEWEVRYELVHPDWGATQGLAARRAAAFYDPNLSLRIPAARGGFEDVRFAITLRAYQGDFWVAERTLEARRGERLEVVGFPIGRPGRQRFGRRLEVGLPAESKFGRLIFQAAEPDWWVDMLDRARREIELPTPPDGLPDPLTREDAPLMRAHFFDRLDSEAWNGVTAAAMVHHGVSTER